MPRTTEAAVQAIVETEDDISLTPFIEVANMLVTKKCLDSDYDDAQLELIERWLSAHFYAVRDLRRSSEKAGSVGESFQYKVDLNLAVTVYGQQAMVIDTDGNLAKLNKETGNGGPMRASVTWVGTAPETDE